MILKEQVVAVIAPAETQYPYIILCPCLQDSRGDVRLKVSYSYRLRCIT